MVDATNRVGARVAQVCTPDDPTGDRAALEFSRIHAQFASNGPSQAEQDRQRHQANTIGLWFGGPIFAGLPATARLFGTPEQTVEDLTALNLEIAGAAVFRPHVERLGAARPPAEFGVAGATVAEDFGRPVIEITRDRIGATKPTLTKGDHGQPVWNWKLYARVNFHGHEVSASFADVDADVTDPDRPGPPDQWLLPKEATFTTGAEDPPKLKLQPKDFSFTDISLQRNQQVWEQIFGRSLENYGGSLAKENLANFQVEYDKIRAANRDLTPQEIGNLAIRRVSFGIGRIRRGFDDVSVEMMEFRDVIITDGRYRGQRIENVPTEVIVSARKSSGPRDKP